MRSVLLRLGEEETRVDQTLCFVTGNLDSRLSFRRTIGLVRFFFFKSFDKGFIIYVRKVSLLFFFIGSSMKFCDNDDKIRSTRYTIIESKFL